MRKTLEITRSRMLVLLWTFALGVALSYQPPEIVPVAFVTPTLSSLAPQFSSTTSALLVPTAGTGTVATAALTATTAVEVQLCGQDCYRVKTAKGWKKIEVGTSTNLWTAGKAP